MKHCKNDCVGVLLGHVKADVIVVEDAVPLFHDRVFASALESAFEMVSLVSELAIVGVYDAPLKYKSGEAVPLSSLSLSIAEQVKATLGATEVVALSIRVPNKLDDEDEDLVKEDIVMDAFVIGVGSRTHKAKLQDLDLSKVATDLAKGVYRSIVDFDDHFNEDISLDWTNPSFN